MTMGYLISVEPIEPSGVMLTVADCPDSSYSARQPKMRSAGPAKPSPFSSATRPMAIKSRLSSWSSAGRVDDHTAPLTRRVCSQISRQAAVPTKSPMRHDQPPAPAAAVSEFASGITF